MNGNISILLCSILLIIIVSYYFVKKTDKIDILDIYIIFLLFHFGVYAFVRGLYFGKDFIFDFRQADPFLIGLVFIHILIIIVVLKLFSKLLIKNNIYLTVERLVDNYSHVNKYVLLCIYTFLIFFNFFSYYQYGVWSYIQPEDFQRFGKSLPYWFTSMRTIYNCVTFCVCLVLVAKALKSQARGQQIFWLTLFIIFIPFATIFGKRFYVNILLLSFIFFMDTLNLKIFQLRNLKYGFILLLAFFLFSNVFQSYRGAIDIIGQNRSEQLKDLPGPFAALLNFHGTSKAFAKRPGTWEFNYLVLTKQLQEGIPPTRGEIFKEGFKSAIPRFFWPEKKFALIDDMLANLYGEHPKAIDIGKNLFGIVQSDFYFFSILIGPLIIIVLLILMSYLNQITQSYPLFYWLISTNILYYLVNIEENGNEIFFMLRNILLLCILFTIMIVGKKILGNAGKKFT